eukprot:scaffold14007_cov143-Amphora_coffeaeformis.AAC.1
MSSNGKVVTSDEQQKNCDDETAIVVLDTKAAVWCLGESCENRKMRIQWDTVVENNDTNNDAIDSYEVCVNCTIPNGNSNKDDVTIGPKGALHHVPCHMNDGTRKQSFILTDPPM